MVHKAYDSDELAVIGILFDSSKNIGSCIIHAQELDHIIKHKGNETIVHGEIDDLRIPLMQFVQRISPNFFHYKGSLTTPPCSETVNWIVMSEVQYMSLEEQSVFNAFWKGNHTFAHGHGNRRIPMPLLGRTVWKKDETEEQREERLKNRFFDLGSNLLTLQAAFSLAATWALLS